MTEIQDFRELVLLAVKKEALKRLVFSRPIGECAEKISARLCAHRGKRLLSAQSYLPGNTVSQANYAEAEMGEFLDTVLPQYRQVNLITSAGDAELKLGKNGTVVLGADKLLRKLEGEAPSFISAIESLDREKNRMLDGSEDFLIALGVSDKNGRVHDKRQGKFRQINRFLEYLDEIYSELPKDKELTVFDLCCGKSYLSFAVYYYLTAIKGRAVSMLGVDLKRDVINFCNAKASELGYNGMRFVTDDITNLPRDTAPDMVISLHACDIATDIVLDTAASLGAKVILSTPCCHRELSTKISAPVLSFVTKYPKLKRSLCDSLTDALRLERLATLGYEVSATELVDPEDTPKNTLLRAIKRGEPKCADEYNELLRFLLGDGANDYIGKISRCPNE